MKEGQRGQGLVEYALILVLVAIVVIAVLLLIGPEVDSIFNQILCAAQVEEYCLETVSSVSMLASTAPAEISNGAQGFDALLEFRDLSLHQEEAIYEVKQQLQEATGEAFEVLIEYADDMGDDGLYLLFTQAQQAASGDYANLPSALEEITAALGETPPGVQVAVILKTEPYLINSYWELDGTQVPYEAFEAALQEIEQHVGEDSGAIPLMNEVGELVQQRNLFIEEIAQPYLREAACSGITSLNDNGYFDLAQQFEAQLPPSSCGN